MTGVIFNVQDFCVDDGPGIRTTVFLKGCPLRCAWCHNPESHERQVEILFSEKKCAYCSACAQACSNSAHLFVDGKHIFKRDACIRCGECAKVCFSGGIELCGKEMQPSELLEQIKPNLPFYKNSGGGVTISGGEPLLQGEFTLELCRILSEEGIQVCVETCGYGKTETLLALIPYVEYFLFDFKLKGEHTKKYLGVTEADILKNLAALSDNGGKIILRCPIIPDVNFHEKHFADICELAVKTVGITEIQLLPYHPLGIEKAKTLGKSLPYQNEKFLEGGELKPYAEKLQKQTNKKTTVL
jgi:pyruvate formate lyase activating enzyme